jgi:hypothetical protein
METLHPNWVTEGTLDFEYKKYILLAYLQHCRERFGETRLYPPLAELVQHYRQLAGLKAGMEGMQDQFPRELQGIDFKRLEMHYEPAFNPDEYISTITDIIDFALPTVRETIREGKDIYEFIERHIEFMPVGIEPIYRDEGFLLIHEEPQSDVFIYAFRYSVIPHSEENLRGLELKYLCSERRSLANTIEQIKLSLSQRYPEFPNPATFFCLSRLQVPLSETLLPVTKRILMKRLAA